MGKAGEIGRSHPLCVDPLLVPSATDGSSMGNEH